MLTIHPYIYLFSPSPGGDVVPLTGHPDLDSVGAPMSAVYFAHVLLYALGGTRLICTNFTLVTDWKIDDPQLVR